MQLRCLDCILQHLQSNRIHQSDTVMVISPFPKCQTLRAGACFESIKFRYERFWVMCSSHGADHRFQGMLPFEMVTLSKALIFSVVAVPAGPAASHAKRWIPSGRVQQDYYFITYFTIFNLTYSFTTCSK